MPYIGKEPIVGNFQKCDAITVVNGQAAYTLQVGGTNVVPEGNNHCLVSLNGILQSPTTSFSVSSSTLTFASNLATGDVIDFVILLGNVLDLGVPSDASITNAKLAQDIISGETELASEPSDTDELLLSDAGTLKRIDYSLIKASVSPSFFATLGSHQAIPTGTETVIAVNTESYDDGGCYNNTSGAVTLNGISVPAYSFCPNVAGKYLVVGQIQDLTGAGAYDILYIYKNSTTVSVIQNQGDIGDARTWNAAVIVDLNGTGDDVNIRRYHNAGSDKSTYGNDGSTFFGAFRLLGV